jgi:hypothetical protein
MESTLDTSPRSHGGPWEREKETRRHDPIRSAPMTTPTQPQSPFKLLAPVADPKAQPFRDALARHRPPPATRDFALSAPLYKPDDELRTAVNMAIAVAAPLLVTGEPGTGKTQLAHHLAWYFGIPIFEYVVRSDSTAQDIKYDFDAVAYLRAANAKEKSELRP